MWEWQMKEKVLGIFVVLLTILISVKIEGGNFSVMLCYTSFLLVFGGVLGSLIISFGLKKVLIAFSMVFGNSQLLNDETKNYSEILSCAGKYSMAYGVIGFLIGIIYSLSGLSSVSLIGKHLAVALTSPLYGLVFAYLFFFPTEASLKVGLDKNKEI